MIHRPEHIATTARLILRALIGTALALSVYACRSDDDSQPVPTAVPSSTATTTPTNTPDPSPTPTVDHAHDEIVFGSTEAGGGDLNREFDGGHQHLSFAECLGGTGEECEGGIAIFSSDAPGFEHVEEDEPAESLYRLDDGTTVSVVIVAIDDGLSLAKGGVTADAPGESIVIGTIPDLDHDHVEYIAAIPGGMEGWRKHVTFRLTAAGVPYGPSEPLELEFGEAHE